MEKGKIRFVVALVIVIALSGILFGVLYREQVRRITKAESDRQVFLEEQRAIEQERKRYFDGIATRRTELRAHMEENRLQYEELLKNQPSEIAKNQTTTTQKVTVPVQTTVKAPVAVAKPKATRKTKSS